MKQTDDLPLAHAIIAQLRGCGHFLYYRMGGRTGRRRILMILYDHQVILQKELQDILKIQSGSLSEVIIKMEADGLIEKVRSESDGRQWALRLTKNGQMEAVRLKAAYDKQVAEMMGCFSQEQLHILHELLNTMFTHWNTLDIDTEQKNTKK